MSDEHGGGLSGLGDAPGTAHRVATEADAVLQTTHAELVRTAWTRKAVEDALQGNQFWLERDGRDINIVLENPVGLDPRWNQPGSGDLRRASLLSWTQKMGTPSFSLPAGPPQSGGACPGAIAGQTIVSADQLLKAEPRVTRVTGRPVSLPDAICQTCYAEGGNYQYGSMQFVQVLRFLWVRSLVEPLRGEPPGGSAARYAQFVDTMSWAIENADYHLDGGVIEKVDYAPERYPGRYFRIHDSGDFHVPNYLRAWKDVANNFRGTGPGDPNRITFWAPTRIWATRWGIDEVNEINSEPDSNLIIRPSAYHVNERPPTYNLGRGWSHWSVVYNIKVKPRTPEHLAIQAAGAGAQGHGSPYDWDCQAYAVVDEAHSCRNARGPHPTDEGDHGDEGCRACWVAPDKTINYTAH
jgi:hypothetical protein